MLHVPHSALENWEVLETEQNKNKPEESRHTLENKGFLQSRRETSPYFVGYISFYLVILLEFSIYKCLFASLSTRLTRRKTSFLSLFKRQRINLKPGNLQTNQYP